MIGHTSIGLADIVFHYIFESKVRVQKKRIFSQQDSSGDSCLSDHNWDLYNVKRYNFTHVVCRNE